jgi:hypothetical protein
LLIFGLVNFDFFYEVLTILENLSLEQGDKLTFKLLGILTPVGILSDEKGIIVES